MKITKQICGLVVLFALALSLFGCGGGDSSARLPEHIYIGGYYVDGINTVPCYWRDAIRVNLEGVSSDARVCSIKVAGGTVYSAGYYTDGKSIPCYWIGTSKTTLTLPTGEVNGYANSIFVVGNIIYTVGYFNVAGSNTPCYWIGTSRTSLSTSGFTNAMAKAVYVRDNTIYAAGNGNSGSSTIPCYWEGTENPTTFSVANGSAESIYVASSGTVYTAGSYQPETDNLPCYWEGTSKNDLTLPNGTSEGTVQSVVVSANGTVYTAGYCNGSPCYWIGKIPTLLPVPLGVTDGSAESIYVTGDGTIYTVGSYYDTNKKVTIACYWQGNNRIDLTDLPAGVKEAYGFSIVVAE